MLVAGGIGITPMYATFMHLLSVIASDHDNKYSYAKSVRLIWCVKDKKDASIFADDLKKVFARIDNAAEDGSSKNHRVGNIFSVGICITGGLNKVGSGNDTAYSSNNSSKSTVEYNGHNKGCVIKYSRPDLQAEMLAISPWGLDSLCYVCGPSSLVETCSVFSRMINIDFKSESFEL